MTNSQTLKVFISVTLMASVCNLILLVGIAYSLNLNDDLGCMTDTECKACEVYLDKKADETK